MAQGLGRELSEQPKVKDSHEKKTSGKEGRVAGSRRIFAPQFKLQVLDSYRQDADCRGNQRATARKYGIHRRQIQKWLQAEASLRTALGPGPDAALNLSPVRPRDTAPPPPPRQPPPDCEPDVDVEDDDEDDDSDDDDIDIMSVQDSDQALDFTSAALSKRRSFSLQFKLEVLDAFHADPACHGNQRATARKFGINRRQVQKWLGQEAGLRGEAAFRGGMYRQRLGRWPDGEDADPPPPPHCWDLSRKRRAEPDPCDERLCKRSCPGERDDSVQETALCLKVERRAWKPEPCPVPALYPPVPPAPGCCCYSASMMAVYHGLVAPADHLYPHDFRPHNMHLFR